MLDLERLGPIDRTPGIPGSDKNQILERIETPATLWNGWRLPHTDTDWPKCFCIYRLKCSKAISGWLDGQTDISGRPYSKSTCGAKNAILDGCSTVDSKLDYDGIGWYSMVLHGIRWYCMVFDGIAWYSMVFCYWIVFIGIQRYCMVFDGIAGYYMVFDGIQ